MSKGLVHFMHGKESGPNGSKIVALAEVARQQGWDVASLDYSHTVDPALRLEQLRDACTGLDQPLVLAGSSMGGWVAAEASAWVDAHGVFLLAPALYMPGYPTQAPPYWPPMPKSCTAGTTRSSLARTRSALPDCGAAPRTWCPASTASIPASPCCASCSGLSWRVARQALERLLQSDTKKSCVRLCAADNRRGRQHSAPGTSWTCANRPCKQ